MALGLLATGCFHWAPVESLGEIDDARVRVVTDERTVSLEHATSRGRVVEGVAGDGSREALDVTRDRVLAWRLDGTATGLLVGGIATVLAIAGIIVAAVVASTPPPDMAGGSPR